MTDTSRAEALRYNLEERARLQAAREAVRKEILLSLSLLFDSLSLADVERLVELQGAIGVFDFRRVLMNYLEMRRQGGR